MDLRGKKILITCGLPYANGSLHLGHLVEYIQADIYARFLKMSGHDAIFLCASDTHGTPIEVNAMKQGISPHDMVRHFHEEHLRDFAAFGVEFDDFHTTDSEENRHYAELIFSRLKDAGDIYVKEIEQLYSEKSRRFLPDRFVKGTCPKCKAVDQYGDVCEACGATYKPTDLVDPYSVIDGDTPVLRTSDHYFFRLSAYADRLNSWINSDNHLQPKVRRFVQEWIDSGLRDWDITRDGPYFGFKIPGEENKYFYVWLDAPIGYISTTRHYCERKGLSFDAYWYNPESVILHFIGKDIIYFHTLFWPATLMGAGFQLPKRVIVHGMLTVNGEKMSKSRGTFVNAATYRRHLDPQFLRYYYASKYSSDMTDIDLNLEDFVLRVNADLVNKLANLVSRVVPFVEKRLDGRISTTPDDCATLLEEVDSHARTAIAHYGELETGKALREIITIADIGNKYFQDNEPWKCIKNDPEQARRICTFAVNCARTAAILIKPVLPEFADQVAAILNQPPFTLDDLRTCILAAPVGPFIKLVDRVEAAQVEAMVEESRREAAEHSAATMPARRTEDPALPELKQLEAVKEETAVSETVSIEDLMKIDLRVARVVKAESVEGAERLVRLELDDGTGGRTVFAGIKRSFSPESLVGRNLLLVANLAPRKMKFGVSEGMIMAAGDDDRAVVLCEFIGDVPPGTSVH
ncbi:methionine--tRNA ligase [bacterium]|nr:methionine--tRNA ligase [candidate division CSSED10-310 bacterium]